MPPAVALPTALTLFALQVLCMLHEHGLLRELAALRRYWLGGSAEFVEQLCGHLEAAAERGAPWRGGGTCRRALHQALLAADGESAADGAAVRLTLQMPSRAEAASDAGTGGAGGAAVERRGTWDDVELHMEVTPPPEAHIYMRAHANAYTRARTDTHTHHTSTLHSHLHSHSHLHLHVHVHVHVHVLCNVCV